MFKHGCIASLSCAICATAGGQTYIFADADSSNTSAPSISNTGSTWGTAFKYLPDAVEWARQLHVSNSNLDIRIWVAEGTYNVNQGHYANGTAFSATDKALSITLANNTKIYGGFDGTEAANSIGFAQRDPESRICIITGDNSSNDTGNFGNRSDNSYHVVSAGTTNNTARLDGFRIRGGNAAGTSPDDKGGGANLDNSSCLIVRCVLIDNEAQQGGGGVYTSKATPTLINCRILGNRALEPASPTSFPKPGGGIYVAYGVTLHNCVFSGNSALYGGGVYWPNSGFIDAIAIENCTFSANTASASNGGGAIFCEGAATVDNSILWGNIPDQYVESGGGSVTFANSNVQGTTPSGTNIAADPLFADADGGDFIYGTIDDDLHLTCVSPSLHTGGTSLLPLDIADLNLDSSTTDTLDRDVDMRSRIIGVPLLLDMGAYEKPYTAPACPGEASGDSCVGVADLLAVIGTWGTCGSTCPTDIMPQPCGNGQVNVQDLLTVIDNWTCGCPGGQPPIEDVEDCMEMCSELFAWGSEDWIKCVNACAAQFEE